MSGLVQKDFFGFSRTDQDFDAIKISMASPEQIRAWSHGEVRKPETINYRTFKPEREGLFCAQIFGPIKDYECLCGKYKRMKHRGVICEKCGVEVTLSKVRRERMGHIELAAPVSHVWFLKSLPSRISMLVNMSLKDVENVLYYEKYVVVEPGSTSLKRHQLLTENEYMDAQDDYGDDAFTAMIGGEAVKYLLKDMNLDEEIELGRMELQEVQSEMRRKKLVKRLKLMENFKASGAELSWIVMDVLPVIPPDLRPLVPLDGGRFATSDLNDFYRRVINRNNRLRRLMELQAPGIIIRNEKRMLQESVDALFDNGRRGRAITGANRRPLKSLSNMLKGKQGRFRQNLLGKRVDYSGRSVIVVGPTLKLHQCGLPKKMALELFRPFILARLELYGMAPTIKASKRMIEKERVEVWDILEEVIHEHPVLLNRAPTLHRLGIQAFEPLLIEGKAIQMHPLVCAAFNADFDGDQMAVHVPLSLEAQLEARVLMMSTNNILSPANGKPIIVPSQDMVLGIYYLSLFRADKVEETINFEDGEVFEAALGSCGVVVVDKKNPLDVVEVEDAKRIFADVKKGKYEVRRLKAYGSFDEVAMALDQGVVHLHEPVQIRSSWREEPLRIVTTAGRAKLMELLPQMDGMHPELMNKVFTKKEITNLIDTVYRNCLQRLTVVFCDRLMDLGFRWACRAGISIGKDDLIIPEEKRQLVGDAREVVGHLEDQYQKGLITEIERHNKVVATWSECTDNVSGAMMRAMLRSGERGFNSVYMMAHSGARSSEAQLKQLAGMRGLMAKPSGEIIETPIISNFKEGLSVTEYFNSTHGARKGLADTALKTANSGYLTRRLVDVAQDCVVVSEDCGASEGITLRPVVEGGHEVESISEKVLGRCLASDVKDARTGEVLCTANSLIDETMAQKIEDAECESVSVRSVLTCNEDRGVCARCYGRDMARGSLVSVGEAVGVIAAQSIGEPGTQLTMRTFHIGGAATGGAEQNAIEAGVNGTLRVVNRNVIKDSQGHLVVMGRNLDLEIYDERGRKRTSHRVPYGARLLVDSDKPVKEGMRLAEWDPYSIPIVCEQEGIATFVELEDGVSMQKVTDETTGLVNRVVLDWKHVSKGSEMRPRVTLRNEEGEVLKLPNGMEARYFMSAGAFLNVEDGKRVKPGDVLARIPTESTKNRDITGGLPRVAELFEARLPKDQAILAPVSGVIEIGKDYKNKRRVIIRPEEDEGEPVELMVPRTLHLSAREGEKVERGDMLIDGNPSPHTILELFGVENLLNYIKQEIQKVYRMQGVTISDKHIEVIVHQMLQKVEIVDSGESLYLEGEVIDKIEILNVNKTLQEEGKKEIGYRLVLQGITRASLQTQSFISAASFQETVRVLTEAVVSGKYDRLHGLKENVIAGRLIPVGTGASVRLVQQEADRRDKEIREQRAAQEKKRLEEQEASLVASSSSSGEEGGGEEVAQDGA
jgi:DNA-directed RNA polymerase subunit beta'